MGMINPSFHGSGNTCELSIVEQMYKSFLNDRKACFYGVIGDVVLVCGLPNFKDFII